MRILHVTSDWKWTGPAAPMLQLLLAQRARGCTAELVCPEDPDGRPDSLPQQARAAGVEPLLALARARGAIWWRDSRGRAPAGEPARASGPSTSCTPGTRAIT